MRVDDTILIKNYRGDDRKRVIKIIKIRDTHEQTIKGKTKAYNIITRGQWLVTGKDLDNGEIKCYYVEHGTVKVLDRIGRLLARLGIR